MSDDLFDARAVPLHLQIECAERELGYRRHVYARRVAEGRMTEAKARHELAAMQAIAATLRDLAEMEKQAGGDTLRALTHGA